MYTRLKERLWAYIVQNNPELMFQLQEEYGVVSYLDEKVSAVIPMALQLMEEDRQGGAILELCLDEMTRELRPSRFNYITTILAEEFEGQYTLFKEQGLLTYEAVNLVEYCQKTFEQLSFSEENRDNSMIYAAITGKIADYFFERQEKAEE